jgi:hypothetical protein
MALKHIVNAAEFAFLSDAIKAEYTLKADGTYHINLGGMFVTDKDPAGLFSALESERAEHKTTKSKFDAIAKERDDAKQAVLLAEAQKSGDLDALKKLFDEKSEAIRLEYKKQVDEEKGRTKKQQENNAAILRRTEALKIANELFGDKAELFLPHVLERIQVVAGDNPTVQIVKADGTPDLSMDLEGYKKSFLTNPMFQPMIVKSKASGGSANDGTNVPANRKADGSVRTYEDYKPGELMTLKRSNPELFNQLKLAKSDQPVS